MIVYLYSVGFILLFLAFWSLRSVIKINNEQAKSELEEADADLTNLYETSGNKDPKKLMKLTYAMIFFGIIGFQLSFVLPALKIIKEQWYLYAGAIYLFQVLIGFYSAVIYLITGSFHRQRNRLLSGIGSIYTILFVLFTIILLFNLSK